MDDWDLHAVVRGCCNSSSTTTTTTASTSITTTSASDLSCDFSWFPPLDLKQEQLYFPDLFNTRTPIEDLEQLCKPFLPPLNLSLPTSSSIPATQHQQQQQQIQPPQLLRRSLASPNPSSSTPRPKRRKNQQKRVVCQVPAEGLSSDMWAWRKYGQKPIKGSPYPRGYYRCSSSKGCLARKQVERSRSDPSTFIITYTAEHNHPVPTHRNSLAGSTRNKSTTPKSTTTTTTTTTTPTTTPNSQNHPCSSSSPTTGLSPTTPLSVSDELLQQSKEDGEEVEGMLEEEEDELSFPEDFFMELDEVVGSTTTSSGSQFSASFPWIAAAGGS